MTFKAIILKTNILSQINYNILIYHSVIPVKGYGGKDVNGKLLIRTLLKPVNVGKLFSLKAESLFNTSKPHPQSCGEQNDKQN